MSASDIPDCGDDEHQPHHHRGQSAGQLALAARRCAAMGDAERLRLLGILLEGAHCVSELTNETGDSMSLVSQRLKILADAGLVARRRAGKHVFYSLPDDHVRLMIENLFSTEITRQPQGVHHD